MSNSNYANLSTGDSADEDIMNFAPVDVEEDIIPDNTFQGHSKSMTQMEPLHASKAARRNTFHGHSKSMTGMEPLHASQAASRLSLTMDNNDMNDMTDLDDSPFVPTASVGSSNSLLERIQKQRRQQQPVPEDASAPAPIASAENQFGYPMTEDTSSYSYVSSASAPPTQIPDYSTSTNIRDPYNESASTTDYKEKMFNILSTVGSAAGSAAKGAYRGTKRLYGNAVSQRGASGGIPSQERMSEMDYQSRSLLQDPHDLEASSMTGVGGMSRSGIMGTAPVGLRAGFNGGASMAAESGYTLVGYAKQFFADVKDIFLASPRYVQLIAILLFIFILWLFISEEL